MVVFRFVVELMKATSTVNQGRDPFSEATQQRIRPTKACRPAGKSGEFECKPALPGAQYVFAQLFFVRRKNADAAPASRDRHIPLLIVGGSLDSGIRK